MGTEGISRRTFAKSAAWVAMAALASTAAPVSAAADSVPDGVTVSFVGFDSPPAMSDRDTGDPTWPENYLLEARFRLQLAPGVSLPAGSRLFIGADAGIFPSGLAFFRGPAVGASTSDGLWVRDPDEYYTENYNPNTGSRKFAYAVYRLTRDLAAPADLTFSVAGVSNAALPTGWNAQTVLVVDLVSASSFSAGAAHHRALSSPFRIVDVPPDPKADTNGTGVPGLYAYPRATAAGRVAEFSTLLRVMPTMTANIFWSHQFGISGTSGGYTGVQTYGNTNGRQWLFSLWGATDAEVNPSLHGVMAGDTDGAPGRSVRVFRPWTTGRTYVFRVAEIPGRPGWWNSTVTDTADGTSFSIGNLFVPQQGALISPQASWVEYWNWNDSTAQCLDQENSDAVYAPLRLDGLLVPYVVGKSNPPCSGGSVTIAPDGSARLRAYPGT